MNRARGYKSKLALCFESEFGTTPAVPVGYGMPFNSSKIAVKQNLTESNTLTGRRDPAQPSPGNIDVSGGIVVPVDKIAIGWWLRAMFGVPTTSGAGDPYTHVFKPIDVQEAMVLEQQYPGISQYELFNGCKVSKFSMSIGGDGELTASVDVMGAKRTIGIASFDDTLTDILPTKFKNFQASIDEGGTALAIVTQADINIDFGMDGDSYAIGGAGFRADISEGLIQVSGTLKAFFKDASLLNKAVNNTATSLKLKLTSGTHSLEFLMEECMFEQTSPGIDGPKGLYIDLPYRAFLQTGASGAVVVATLKNSQASYEG